MLLLPQTFDETMAAAKQGAAYAQYNLGLCMTMAKVCQRTMLRQLSGSGKLLIKGHAKAQSNLGVMYDNGKGVPENDAEAVKWYRKAADQGHARLSTT